MKIQHLTGINPDFKDDDLIRLFDFDPIEAKKFQSIIKDNILEMGLSIDLTNLDFIHSVNCSLTLKLGNQDSGIQRIEETKYECELAKSSYRNMVDLIEPFTQKDTNRHQWLYDIDPLESKTELLFSPRGNW